MDVDVQVNVVCAEHPHRTHDLRSGSQDHHLSKNSVQKAICCNSTSNAPDDGCMYPETCRANNTSIKLPSCIKLAFHFISYKHYISLHRTCNWKTLVGSLSGSETYRKMTFHLSDFFYVCILLKGCTQWKKKMSVHLILTL